MTPSRPVAITQMLDAATPKHTGLLLLLLQPRLSHSSRPLSPVSRLMTHDHYRIRPPATIGHVQSCTIRHPHLYTGGLYLHMEAPEIRQKIAASAVRTFRETQDNFWILDFLRCQTPM
jgi:hypothetical protein